MSTFDATRHDSLVWQKQLSAIDFTCICCRNVGTAVVEMAIEMA